MAIGQERDAWQHPRRESFHGEIARFLIYERSLNTEEFERVIPHLRSTYASRGEMVVWRSSVQGGGLVRLHYGAAAP